MPAERKHSSLGAMLAARLATFVAASVVSIGVTQAADLTNPGFENGLTGWQASGPFSVTVASTFTSPSGFTSGPCCGDSHFFAVMPASNNGASGTSLTQIVTLAAGQSVNEAVRFIVDDNFFGTNDVAALLVSGPSADYNPYLQTAFDVGFGEGAWTPIRFQAPEAGAYTFEFNVTSGATPDLPVTSYLLVDTPEPSGIALIAVGLTALGLMRRRR